MWDWLVGWLVGWFGWFGRFGGLFDSSCPFGRISWLVSGWLGGSGQIFENTNGRSEDAAVAAFFLNFRIIILPPFRTFSHAHSLIESMPPSKERPWRANHCVPGSLRAPGSGRTFHIDPFHSQWNNSTRYYIYSCKDSTNCQPSARSLPSSINDGGSQSTSLSSSFCLIQ